MESFNLEKHIWTQDDFKFMGWHDATIWSSFANTETYEFSLDLDYIFKWVEPEGTDKYFKFWVAPVTMIFENVSDVKFDIESRQGDIEIADLYMENPKLTPNGKFTEHTFRFECQEGVITLQATGFKMYVRQNPTLSKYQGLDVEVRGGVNFGKVFKAL
jgi:hypothetical protein